MIQFKIYLLNHMNEQEPKINRPIQDLVESTQKNSTVGPIIGSIIVIILIIGGGLYFFSLAINARKVQIRQEQIEEEQKKTKQIENIIKQSNSDDINDIETDLNSITIDQIEIQTQDQNQ